MEFGPKRGDALLVIDVQNDFLPGGALAVEEGDAVIGPINEVLEIFTKRGLPIVFTRDWHPADHSSFRSQGGPWPPHCVAGTSGAEFAAELARPAEVQIVSKGAAAADDSYSNFEQTNLESLLRQQRVDRVFVAGLATDYCVRSTVLDALAHGFRVVVLTDAVRSIDTSPGGAGERALAEMESSGATLATTRELA